MKTLDLVQRFSLYFRKRRFTRNNIKGWPMSKYTFIDQNQNKVILVFKRNVFTLTPKHVLVICRFNHQWLLTDHPGRGLEFPGGKVEQEETIEEAGIREVYEETGGIASIKAYLGEYEVNDSKSKPFVKAILFAEISQLSKKDHYLETKGPVLVDGNLETQLSENPFSYIMKDGVVQAALRHAKQAKLF